MKITKTTPPRVTILEIKPGELFVHTHDGNIINHESLYLRTKSGAVDLGGVGTGNHIENSEFMTGAIFRVVTGVLSVEGCS